MTPSELLAVLDDAIAYAYAYPGPYAVDLTAPVVLGVRGYPNGRDPDGRVRYGYTRRQCKRIRRALLAEARAGL